MTKLKRLAAALVVIVALIVGVYTALHSQSGGYTLVTATVMDTNSTLYVNAPFNVVFFDPGTSGKLPLLNGSTFQQSFTGINTNSAGQFSVSLPDNGVIAATSGATGTSWIFNFCSAQYQNPTTKYCFSYQTAINASPTFTLNLTSALQAVAPILPPPGGGGGSAPVGNQGDLQDKNGTVLGASHINDGGTVPAMLLASESFGFKGPRPWVDVTTFGAKGNSTGAFGADDTVPIQNAINAACAATGTGGVVPIVYFPPGQYKLSQPQVPSTRPVFVEPCSIEFQGSGYDPNSGVGFPVASHGSSLIVGNLGGAPNNAPVFAAVFPYNMYPDYPVGTFGGNIVTYNLNIVGWNQAMYVGGSQQAIFRDTCFQNYNTAVGVDSTPLKITDTFEVYMDGGCLNAPAGGGFPVALFTGEDPGGSGGPSAVGLVDFRNIATTNGEFVYDQRTASVSSPPGLFNFQNIIMEANYGDSFDAICSNSNSYTFTGITLDNISQSDNSVSNSAVLRLNCASVTASGIKVTHSFAGNAGQGEAIVVQQGTLYGYNVDDCITSCIGTVVGTNGLPIGVGQQQSWGGGTWYTGYNDTLRLRSDFTGGTVQNNAPIIGFIPAGGAFATMALDPFQGLLFNTGTNFGYDTSINETVKATINFNYADTLPPTALAGTAAAGGSIANGTYTGVIRATPDNCTHQSAPSGMSGNVVLSGGNGTINWTWSLPVGYAGTINGYCLSMGNAYTNTYVFVSGASTASYSMTVLPSAGGTNSLVNTFDTVSTFSALLVTLPNIVDNGLTANLACVGTSASKQLVAGTCSGGGGGTPGGSNGQIQYNNAGAFGGSPNFTFSGSNVQIGLQTAAAGTLTLASAGAGSIAISYPNTGNVNTFVLPGNAGSTGQALTTNGAGVLSWQTVLTSPLASLGFLNGGGTVTVTVGGTSGTYTLILPPNAGTNGQALVTNGSGTTNWATVANNNCAAGSNELAVYATAGVSTSCVASITAQTSGGAANLLIGGAGLTPNLVLFGSSSGSTTINSASTGTWTLTLPNSAGTTGYSMINQGSGTTQWAQVSLSIGVTGILPPANGGVGVSSPTAHTVPVAEGSSVYNFLSPGIAGLCFTSNGTSADPTFQTCPSGFTNPMTTLGDLIYGGSVGAATRLAGPVGVNGVPQVLISTPSGGVATAVAWSPLGVPIDAQTGTSYTYVATDRTSYVSFSNASSVAVGLPQAGTTGFQSNWPNVSCNIGAGTATITPSTSTISYTTGNGYTGGASTLALTTGQCAFIYSDNSNYFAIKLATGTGSGTVNSGTQYQLAYYATGGTAVSGTSSPETDAAGDLILGSGCTVGSGGSLCINGSSSGTLTVAVAAAVGTNTVTFSAQTGTVVEVASGMTNTHVPKATGNYTLTDGFSVQGSDSALLTSGTISGTGATLCTDANGGATTSGCSGGGGSTALSALTAASGANTIASGNNVAQIWNWAMTTNGATAFTFGETTAATGTGTNYILKAVTIAGSTASPLNLTNSLTGSQTLCTLCITPTWNTSGVVDAALLVNVTNTGSGAASLLADLQIGGTSEWKVDKGGNTTQTGNVNLGASCTVASGGFMCVNGSSSGTFTLAVAAAAGTNTATFPALTGTVGITTGSLTNGDLASFNSTGQIIDASVVAANVLTTTTAAGGANQIWVSNGANKTAVPIDFPDVKVIPAANCVNSTAASAWNTSLTPACIAGSNNLGGYLPFVDASVAQFEYELPLDWDTAAQPYFNLFFLSNTNTSGTVIFNVAVACYKSDGSTTADPSFNTADTFATKTMATATRGWSTSIQSTHTTSGNSCVPGGTLLAKITRATDTAGSAVWVTKATVTTSRLITVQAN